jgi:hypothetical protein
MYSTTRELVSVLVILQKLGGYLQLVGVFISTNARAQRQHEKYKMYIEMSTRVRPL